MPFKRGNPGCECCDTSDCDWPKRISVGVALQSSACRDEYGGGGCASWLPGVSIRLTGPGGYDETAVTPDLPSGLNFAPFDVPAAGDYTATVVGGLPPRVATPAPVTVPMGCGDRLAGLTAHADPAYVLLCPCPTEPIARTLNWQLVGTPWGGTAAYYDDPSHPWRGMFVGCASGTLLYDGTRSLPFGTGPSDGGHCPEGHGGISYLTACADDPYVPGPNNCVELCEDSQGVAWVFIWCVRSTAAPGYSWAWTIVIRGCPTLGRSCSEADYFGGDCADIGAIGSAYTLATGTQDTDGSKATKSCGPLDVSFPIPAGGLSLGGLAEAALGISGGGTLRFWE